MKGLIATICMGVMAVSCGTGCTSFDFQLSQTEGLHIQVKGAPPTLYKLVSYEKTGEEKAFDLFHFQAEGAEVGEGTVLREPEPEGDTE